MHKLLSNLLLKRGIESIKDLDESEKQDFENWNKVLSKRELTTDDIKNYCKTQCDNIEIKWAEYSVKHADKAELLPYFTVYRSILMALESPDRERKAIENQITNLL